MESKGRRDVPCSHEITSALLSLLKKKQKDKVAFMFHV